MPNTNLNETNRKQREAWRDMATVIKMPVLGQSVDEVRILQWFKSEGELVQKGERLAEIETDKTNIEWDSPETGIVRQILVPADSYVKVEAPIVIFGDADEVPPPPAPPRSGEGSSETSQLPPLTAKISSETPPVFTSLPSPLRGGAGGGGTFASPRARRVADEFGVSVALLAGRGTGPNGRIIERDVIAFHEESQSAARQIARSMDAAAEQKAPKASPLARAVASDTGADLNALAGTGSGGRIVADDVRGQAAPPAQAAASVASGTRTVTITGLRKRVADNLARSIRNAPHVTLHLQADMEEAMRLRKEILPAIEKTTGGIRVSPTDIIMKACAVALREHPNLNAHRDGDIITLFDDVHLGLAVSLGDDGLIVPVIRNAHQKGLADLARDRTDVAKRARDNKLGGADLSGGTFTITNLGSYGINAFNPIIAPPQVAILGVGGISEAVVARNGLPVVRPMMGLSLSFDHAALDGAPAAAFLARIKEILETPYLLLL